MVKFNEALYAYRRKLPVKYACKLSFIHNVALEIV